MTERPASALPPGLIALVERAVNRILSLDPEAIYNISRMDGKVLAVDLKGLERTVFIFPQREGVRLAEQHTGDVHVRIRGTPLALLAMGVNRNRGNTATFSGEVEIIGDLALGQHLQTVFGSLDIDWEELLSHYVGDVAAHQLGNLGRGMRGWVSSTGATMQLNTVEYIRNELEILPQASDVQRFMNDVDTLRMDVDRLEARASRLAQRLPPESQP